MVQLSMATDDDEINIAFVGVRYNRSMTEAVGDVTLDVLDAGGRRTVADVVDRLATDFLEILGSRFRGRSKPS